MHGKNSFCPNNCFSGRRNRSRQVAFVSAFTPIELLLCDPLRPSRT
jgi:hypothetical protein